ncbi:MAG: 30S ribosomal protein S12 methylthiotransferase RimO [Flavobacteriales bacterium]|nr:30S ribosomal protein S12 methylthiotransferase RimO [Flavobacteriales bacterium]
MKTKTLKKNKINVVTLGCAKNLFDSEVMMSQLKANNYEVEHESQAEDSSIVIVNTCGFIESAKEESVNTILQFVEAKEAGLIERLYVTGCLSERYKDDLEKEIPDVDKYFGTKDLPKLLKTLRADYKKELIGERLLTTPAHYAYLKIAEGCDRPCSFCAIPLMRGKHQSTPIEELLDQVRNLVKNGTKEVLLIAQDLTFYGLDLYKERKLADLLDQMAKIEGLDWIRLHYAYPAGFPMEVIEVMKKHKNICNYLDMPLQHGSTSVLKAMRRGITREKTTKLIHDIRAIIPDIAIRTTLIVGYPGETEEDFQEMMDWVEEMQFERLGAFTYSHEENTHAFNFEDDVPQEIKQKRANAVMELQAGISHSNNIKKVGKVFEVLFDRVEDGFFIGRTEYDSPEVDNEVLVPVSEENHIRIGDFARVEITSAEPYDLYGKIVD